jgi:hypothetical protein
VRATDLRQVKVSEDDFGLLSYDAALLNTASCRSAITFIDGDRGVLRYHPPHETSNEPATAPEHSENPYGPPKPSQRQTRAFILFGSQDVLAEAILSQRPGARNPLTCPHLVARRDSNSQPSDP